MLRFYLSKAWREQHKALFIIPVVAFVVCLVLAATVYFFPQALTSSTLHSVNTAASSLDTELDEQKKLLVAAIISQAPLLTALFAGLLGANLSIGMADIEVRSGAVEVVLSRGIGKTTIVRALALAATILGLLSTAVLVLAIFGASAWYLGQTAGGVGLPWKTLVLPWPCLLVGIACGLVIQLLFPKLSHLRAGTSGNIAQLLAVLPTLAIVLVYTLSSRAAASSLTVWVVALVFTLIAVVLMSAVARRLNTSKLLLR